MKSITESKAEEASKVQCPKSKVSTLWMGRWTWFNRSMTPFWPTRLWTLDFGLWTLLLLLSPFASAPLRAADSGASVVVVYNSKMAESKEVAEYYAERRQVPANQVFGFDLPVTE